MSFWRRAQNCQRASGGSPDFYTGEPGWRGNRWGDELGRAIWLSGVDNALQLGSKSHHGLGVDLANPGFGDPEDISDLLHVEIFVVVEGDHEPFLVRQRADGVGDDVLGFQVLERGKRIGRFGVFENVGIGPRAFTVRVVATNIFEVDEGNASNLVDQAMEFLDG